MKTIILFTILTISSFTANAQNDNPYAIFGHKTDVTYESKISDYLTIKNIASKSDTMTMMLNV